MNLERKKCWLSLHSLSNPLRPSHPQTEKWTAMTLGALMECTARLRYKWDPPDALTLMKLQSGGWRSSSVISLRIESDSVCQFFDWDESHWGVLPWRHCWDAMNHFIFCGLYRPAHGLLMSTFDLTDGHRCPHRPTVQWSEDREAYRPGSHRHPSSTMMATRVSKNDNWYTSYRILDTVNHSQSTTSLAVKLLLFQNLPS